MLLLISDANILMDIEVGDLVAPMFSLGYQFAVPDVLLENSQRCRARCWVSKSPEAGSAQVGNFFRVCKMLSTMIESSRS